MNRIIQCSYKGFILLSSIDAGKASVQFYTQIKTVAQQWRGLPSLGGSLSILTSCDVEANRGVSSALERDLPKERVPPNISMASERDSPKHGELLSGDLSNSGASSMPQIVDEDLPGQDESLVLSPTVEQDLSDRERSLAIPSATERNSSRQGMSLNIMQTSESIYTPQLSKWNENLPLTSQRTESISSTAQRIYMPASQRNGKVGPSSKRTDAAMALTSDCVYMSTSNENDNMGPISHRSVSDSISPASHGTDASVHPVSERLFDIISSSH